VALVIRGKKTAGEKEVPEAKELTTVDNILHSQVHKEGLA